MLSGPSDTGKSVTRCLQLHWTALRYPNSQHSIVRKSYESMAGSVLKTFGRVIAGAGVMVIGADSPRLYNYPNGSQVWVGGMDKPEKTLSSERDTIFVNQAEQLTLQDWEMLSRITSGRGAVVKWPQLYGDCNPGGSKHWIREQAKCGKLALFESRHEDNPTIYRQDGTFVEDGETVRGQLVQVGGARRMAALDALTGVRYLRLRKGVWATAEGAVFENFDVTVHVLKRPASEFKRWFLCQDEGFSNPAVILLVGEDSDGRWHVAREFYQTGQLEEAVVKVAKQWFVEFKCELDAVDSAAAGLIATLKSLGVNAVGGKGHVEDGCNKIRDRLKVQGDGKPRLTFDPSCENCVNEMESYVLKPGSDVPVKENDHCCDAIRYLADATQRTDSPARSTRPAAYSDRLAGVRGESMW